MPELARNDTAECDEEPGTPDPTGSSSDAVVVLPLVADVCPKAGRPGFFEVFAMRGGVRVQAKAIGEFQPLPYNGHRPAERYALRCLIDGHKACSRTKTHYNIPGEEAGILQKLLCDWLLSGLTTVGCTSKEDHKNIP